MILIGICIIITLIILAIVLFFVIRALVKWTSKYLFYCELYCTVHCLHDSFGLLNKLYEYKLISFWYVCSLVHIIARVRRAICSLVVSFVYAYSMSTCHVSLWRTFKYTYYRFKTVYFLHYYSMLKKTWCTIHLNISFQIYESWDLWNACTPISFSISRFVAQFYLEEYPSICFIFIPVGSLYDIIRSIINLFAACFYRKICFSECISKFSA